MKPPWQDAMTSKQVLWILAALLLGGCNYGKGADPLMSPYTDRRLLAVVPLRNESGSLQIDGVKVAEYLARHLENASNVDVVAVNRVLVAMDATGIRAVRSTADVYQLMGVLGVDGIVIGTVTNFDPYDPPKLGMAIELYSNPRSEPARAPDIRGLQSAAVDRAPLPAARVPRPTSVSAYLDASDPDVRAQLKRYASNRGQVNKRDDEWVRNPLEEDDQAWRFYRINSDLYTEFVCYVMSWRLLKAETDRLSPPPETAHAQGASPGSLH